VVTQNLLTPSEIQRRGSPDSQASGLATVIRDTGEIELGGKRYITPVHAPRLSRQSLSIGGSYVSGDPS
jgi:hypothetical protein